MDGSSNSTKPAGTDGWSAPDQALDAGEPQRLVTGASGLQTGQTVATLEDGGFVVAWVSIDTFGRRSVYFQLYDAGGQPAGAETLVTEVMSGTGELPAVAGLADGGFVIAYPYRLGTAAVMTSAVYLQRFDAEGERVGPQLTIDSYSFNYTAREYAFVGAPSIAGLEAGGWLIGWLHEHFDPVATPSYQPTTFVQRYDSAGAPLGDPMELPGNQPIEPLSDGGYAVGGLLFAADGTSQGSVAVDLDGAHRTAIESLEGGGYVVVSLSATNVLTVQRLDGSGQVAGAAVTIADASAESLPEVVPLDDGGYVVLWLWRPDPAAGVQLLGQRFDAAGEAVGGRMDIVAPEPYAASWSQTPPAAVALDSGGFALAWTVSGPDGPDVLVQRLSPLAALDFFPAEGSNTLPPHWSLAITFDEPVQAGAGTITLRTAEGAVVQTFATATDPGIHFAGQSLIIDPAADLLPGTAYQLIVGADAVRDIAGNAYGGESGHSFTTAGTAPAPDAIPPAAVDFFPAEGSSMLPPDWSLGITFDEDVKAGGGTITLQTTAGAVVQTFATASDPGIQFSGPSLIINPAADLLPGTTYKLIVGADAVVDLAGNAYAGESGHVFTTAGSPPGPAPDATPPAAIDFFPAAGSSMLPPDWSLAITFDEAVKAGAGMITLQTAAGAVVQTFAMATDPGIQFTGQSLIVNPAADLLPGTTYKLIVGADAVVDLAGNAYAGESGHVFTTAGSPPGPAPDATPPAPIDFFPAAGSSMLPPDWSLGITFNEDVQAGAGTITLQTAAGEVVQTFVTASDPGIRFAGPSLIIDPAADLEAGTAYRLIVGADAVEDLAGNAYAGESGYAFSTAGSQLANLAALVGAADPGIVPVG